MTGEPEDSTYLPTDPREFSSRIFHTCYMGTENSSAETRQRAKQLSEAIGRHVFNFIFYMNRILQSSSYHVDLNMDSIVTAVRQLFGFVTGVHPQFRSQGGSNAENLALQNIQVRLIAFILIVFALLWPFSKNFRHVSEWSCLTCLPNSCLGFEGNPEVCWSLEVPTLMKGVCPKFDSFPMSYL